MSSKLIAVLAVLLLAWAGYKVAVYFKEMAEQAARQEQQATGAGVDPARLSGLPSELEPSLRAAQSQGPAAFKRWLEANGNRIQDPRKAWIQLDYCTQIARQNLQEAKAVYDSVKARLRESSPVYPRLKQLERGFE